MPKYLVTSSSFYDVEKTDDELREDVSEALGSIAEKPDGRKYMQRDLQISEVSVMPGEGGAE